MTTNRELYFRDPTTLELLNNGVSKVSEIGADAGQIKTLRFELQNFVCDGRTFSLPSGAPAFAFGATIGVLEKRQRARIL